MDNERHLGGKSMSMKSMGGRMMMAPGTAMSGGKKGFTLKGAIFEDAEDDVDEAGLDGGSGKKGTLKGAILDEAGVLSTGGKKSYYYYYTDDDIYNEDDYVGADDAIYNEDDTLPADVEETE
ncbi:MAG: hypothetical protein SGARI_003007, partial [Bacillariaceae sp.]